MTQPLVIGMIGGTSWQSTIEYYRLANSLVAAELGGLHSARIQLASVDFATLEPLMAADRWDELAGRLIVEARGLQGAGADLLVLCTNSMHRVADDIEAAVDIPFLNIIDVTRDAVASTGAHTVGLLGTAFTLEQDFYRERLARTGLSVVVPAVADRAAVHRNIFDELCLGIVTDEARRLYRDVIERLADAGAQAVVLGCTEQELVVTQELSPLPLFATTRLHVEAAVRTSLAGVRELI
jgi:aspartate racemase